MSRFIAKVDVTVDGFRFYTTTSREDWIEHSDALKHVMGMLENK